MYQNRSVHHHTPSPTRTTPTHLDRPRYDSRPVYKQPAVVQLDERDNYWAVAPGRERMMNRNNGTSIVVAFMNLVWSALCIVAFSVVAGLGIFPYRAVHVNNMMAAGVLVLYLIAGMACFFSCIAVIVALKGMCGLCSMKTYMYIFHGIYACYLIAAMLMVIVLWCVGELAPLAAGITLLWTVIAMVLHTWLLIVIRRSENYNETHRPRNHDLTEDA